MNQDNIYSVKCTQGYDLDSKLQQQQKRFSEYLGKAEKLVNGGTEEESVSETVTKQPTNNSNSPDKPSQN